jgi:hypothetical protein
MDNYNFRAHAMRKISVEFHQSRALAGEALEQKFVHGSEQLQVIRRQRIISELFPEGTSIMQN